MAVDQLKLQVVLGMVDKASGALDKISFGSKKAADALKTTRDAVRKLEYDLYYIRHFSFLLDATIVLKTIHIMLFGKGR